MKNKKNFEILLIYLTIVTTSLSNSIELLKIFYILFYYNNEKYYFLLIKQIKKFVINILCILFFLKMLGFWEKIPVDLYSRNIIFISSKLKIIQSYHLEAFISQDILETINN